MIIPHYEVIDGELRFPLDTKTARKILKHLRKKNFPIGAKTGESAGTIICFTVKSSQELNEALSDLPDPRPDGSAKLYYRPD